MLMTLFTYQNTQVRRDTMTVLTRTIDGETKTFINSGKTSVESMDKFMSNLSDECCNGFFPKPRKQK